MKRFKLAICQNKPGFNKEKNVKQAIEMIETAAARRADLVVLPEILYYPYDLAAIRDIAEKNNETLSRLKDCAKRCKIYLCTGSMAEKSAKGITNTAYLLDPAGKILMRYSKCHLFDVHLKNLKVMESSAFIPGRTVSVATTPLGKIGILICYDIRFPEMARRLTLMGAEILLVPAVFNLVTGPVHWHVTFRSRAIENQVFIAAASQALNPRAEYKAYGHSMIVSPWGEALAEAGTGRCIIYAEIDPQVLKDTRKRLPLLRHRREEIY